MVDLSRTIPLGVVLVVLETLHTRPAGHVLGHLGVPSRQGDRALHSPRD